MTIVNCPKCGGTHFGSRECPFTQAQVMRMADERAMTYGEKAVGLTFNPSGDPLVNDIKKRFADDIDEMDALRLRSTSQEQKRLASIAITEIQGAQMWAVKAATWRG